MQPLEGETLLDVGCGTGWFTRRLARDGPCRVTGLDADLARLAHALSRDIEGHYLAGDARALPFPGAGFDLVVSIAALCFLEDERRALAEIVRVARRRFAVGWMNRASLLHRRKADTGGYRGARWHTAAEVRALFEGLPVEGLRIRSAVFLPSGSLVARLMERLLPSRLPSGVLLLASGSARHGRVTQLPVTIPRFTV